MFANDFFGEGDAGLSHYGFHDVRLGSVQTATSTDFATAEQLAVLTALSQEKQSTNESSLEIDRKMAINAAGITADHPLARQLMAAKISADQVMVYSGGFGQGTARAVGLGSTNMGSPTAFYSAWIPAGFSASFQRERPDGWAGPMIEGPAFVFADRIHDWLSDKGRRKVQFVEVVASANRRRAVQQAVSQISMASNPVAKDIGKQAVAAAKAADDAVKQAARTQAQANSKFSAVLTAQQRESQARAEAADLKRLLDAARAEASQNATARAEAERLANEYRAKLDVAEQARAEAEAAQTEAEAREREAEAHFAASQAEAARSAALVEAVQAEAATARTELATAQQQTVNAQKLLVRGGIAAAAVVAAVAIFGRR